MKKTLKLALTTLLMFTFPIGCNNNINLNNPENEIQIQKNNDSFRSKYVDLSIKYLEQFPESQKLFLEWQTESKESLSFKQDIAKKLVNKNIFKSKDLTEVLSEKGTFQTEAYKPISFDTDQGSHKNKLSEWWYYNGHLYGDNGEKFGYEACFFRVGIIYFAHIAVTDNNNKKFNFERKFYSPSKVVNQKNKNNLTYGESGVEQTGDFSYQLKAEVDNIKLNLNLNLEKKPLIINGNGLIDMPEGTNSYYYSLTRLKTSGTIQVNGNNSRVTGTSWMDHQWGNFIAKFIGWDWFAMQFEDNTEYNLAADRYSNGVSKHFYVNILDPQSKGVHSNDLQIKRLSWWNSPNTGDLYATGWEVFIPSRNETITVTANVLDQEVYHKKAYDVAPDYWEGSCKVTKKLANGKIVNGVGYTEQFPYKFQIP